MTGHCIEVDVKKTIKMEDLQRSSTVSILTAWRHVFSYLSKNKTKSHERILILIFAWK